MAIGNGIEWKVIDSGRKGRNVSGRATRESPLTDAKLPIKELVIMN
jgi:hypothetical protein